MTTIAELVVEDPGASTGVPIQAVYGSGQWRLVVQLADPAAGASVTWYDITSYVEAMKWKRGGDEPFGRYRASQPELLVRGSGDQFAPWNEDTSPTFGTHVRLRGGLLVRAVVFRVVSAAVDLSFPLFTGRVKRWGDSSTSLGRSRFHKVTCLDTMSKLVNKPLPAKSAEGWRPRLNDDLTSAAWQFGQLVYGAETVDGTPTITIDDRDAVPSAIAEFDATLDPVGLVWRTKPDGRLLVHPAPWTTFHDDIFGGAGTIVGNEWVSPTKTYYPGGVRFSYQPVVDDGEVGFYPEADGQPFGIESDVENVVNEWKVTHPDGMGGTADYSYDDPVSASSYDNRPYPAATWRAQNDAVVDDYVDTRAYADLVATQLRTSLDLSGFFPACAMIDQWDDVSVLHATRQERGTVTGTGWLRSIEHTIRNRRNGYISWKATLQLDLTSSEQSDPLLPVEDLAVSSLTADQVDFSWTNPTQTVTPTETQIRIPELSDQWFPTTYPITAFSWLGLAADTTSTFQVRLLRVVDEIVTNVSPVREVTFITPAIAEPTPTGDGTTIVIPPPDDPGCTTDWKLEESDDNGATWSTTTSGDQTDFVENAQGDLELDLSAVSFTDGLLYRVCTNQDCGSGPEGWVCSIPFQPACATPAQLSTAPFDDALMFVPEVCGAEIFEAVSGTEVVPGPGFAGIGTDVDGNYILTSGATGNVVVYGDAPNVPLEDGDRSIHWRGSFDTAAAVSPLLRVGRLSLAVIDVGAGVLKFAAIKSFSGGSITAIGTTTVVSDTEYDVYATWDRDTSTVAIIVDGTEEDTTEDAAAYVNTPNLPTFSARLPANSWCTELAAWNSVVSTETPFSPTDIAALKTWWDASDTATITDAGSGAVSQWNDKTGNARNLTQPTSARRPVTGVTTLNGLNVLNFAGDDVIGDLGATSFWRFLHDGGTGNAIAEVWAVIKPGNTANPNVQMRLWATWNGTSGNLGALVNYADRSGSGENDRLSAFVTIGTGTNTCIGVSSPNDLIPANAFHLIEWITDASNATASQRNTFVVDQGTPSKTNTATNSPAAGDPVQGLMIGGLSISASTDGLIGSVAEILTFDGALTTDERTALRAYLTTKWGL